MLKNKDVVKIKITGSRRSAYWYAKMVGEEFWAEVSTDSFGVQKPLTHEFRICRNVRGHYAYGSFVDPRDCEVLFKLETL